MIDSDDCGAVRGMNEWQWELKYSKKACPSAAVSPQSPHVVYRCCTKLRITWFLEFFHRQEFFITRKHNLSKKRDLFPSSVKWKKIAYSLKSLKIITVRILGIVHRPLFYLKHAI
jgi:hypothetical protein